MIREKFRFRETIATILADDPGHGFSQIDTGIILRNYCDIYDFILSHKRTGLLCAKCYTMQRT